ncbi:collagen alpha-2(I) chain [Ochotona princeps]|uniref:collagen alpha-2(I) chain n=1 Tax=Ochotona princeps TaxID=9978 RepID=UPI00271553C8|nr:collagen alpha-2(I) chain [Ochotona princeps]
MPGRCGGPSRSGRAAPRPWGKRWGAGPCRGRGARRQARSSVGETRCVGAENRRGRRRPWGRRRAVEPTDPAAGADDETAGSAGSTEAARDSRAVWVNGAVGEPQVVGPVGSVWVTGSGQEEESDDSSPRGCDRKGRPGSESILELWLKVRAMRAASGCTGGSRVELHPVAAGEGPVELGVPGQASWVETSRCGLTGPWVKGQTRAFLPATAAVLSMPDRLGAGGAPSFCGQGQVGRVPPPPRVPGHTEEAGSEITTQVLGLGQAMQVPRAGEEAGCGVVPGCWGKGQSAGVREALVGQRGCGGAPRLWERGQSVQVPRLLAQEAICGDIPGLWGRGQAMGVPNVVGVPREVEKDTASMGVPGLCPRRQEDEDVGPGMIPALWGTGQPSRTPCGTEEEARCGGDPRFRERGQSVWVETGCRGGPESWAAVQAAELCGSGGGPGMWGARQPLEVCQAGLVMAEESSCGDVVRLWDRPQALGASPAEAVAGLVREETYSGDTLRVWERGQGIGQQEVPVPAAAVHQRAGCGGVSCLCGAGQTSGLLETVAMPTAATAPRHRCTAVAGVCTALGGPSRVSTAAWACEPFCQEGGSRGVWDLCGRAHAVARPPASRGPMAAEDLWFLGQDPGSGAFPGSCGPGQALEAPGLLLEEPNSEDVPRCWRRRLSDGVPMAHEGSSAPGTFAALEVETGPSGFSEMLGRRTTTGIPVAARVAIAGGVPGAPRMPQCAQDEAGCSSISGLWGRRETVEGPADAKAPRKAGVPASVRPPGLTGEKTGPGGVWCLTGGRQQARVPSPAGADILSGRGLGGLPRAQTAEVPVVASASGLPGPAVGDGNSDDGQGVWGRRAATEAPTVAGAPGPVSGEDVTSLRGRRHSGTAPGMVRVPLPVGVLAAVGVPTAGHAPSAVWVTASTADEAGASVSGLMEGRTRATEGAPCSKEIVAGRSMWNPAGRRRAMGVSSSCGHGARLWTCPSCVDEEIAPEDVPGTSGTSTATVGIPPVSRQEKGLSHFRDGPQQNWGAQVGEVCSLRVRGHSVGEMYMGEDRLRGSFQ